MKQGYIHIVSLLDASGSMSPTRNDTLGGRNAFVESQKQLPGKVRFTEIQFSNPGREVTTVENVNIQEVEPLSARAYAPSGGTALNDCLIKAIDRVGSQLASMPESERPERVLFLITTDGEENSSVEYPNHIRGVTFGGLRSNVVTRESGNIVAKRKIEHQMAKYGWVFTFVGTNIDALATGASYGIPSANSLQFNQSSKGITNAYMAVSNATTGLRQTGDYAYTSQARSAAMAD